MIRRRSPGIPLPSGSALLASACLLVSVTLHAQGGAIDHFTLTSCPRSSQVDKTEFNTRFADVRTEAEYLQALRRTFATTTCCHVRYESHARDGRTEFRVYDIPSARSERVALATLASKGTEKCMVENRPELRTFFADTLAVHGTLRLRVRLSDADFPSDGYYFIWKNAKDGEQYRSNIPSSRDTLLVSADLFGTAPQLAVQVRLRNKARSGIDLATGTLRFTSVEERASMGELVCGIRTQHPEYSSDELTQLAWQFSEAWYGRTLVENLPVIACP